MVIFHSHVSLPEGPVYSQVKLVLSKTSAHPTIMGFAAMGT